MILESYIEDILAGKNLDSHATQRLFLALGRGELSLGESMRILLLLNKKGITTDELLGAVLAFRKLAKPVIHTARIARAMDNCGTGGDGKDTFNISTAAAFVIAACGIPVAKHGNRGVSSKCGSADLFQALGINIEVSSSKMVHALHKTNLGYFHAPLYHAAMRSAAPFRKAIRTKTIFNVLGPLLSPMRVKRQMIGAFDAALLLPMATVLRKLGSKHAVVVHGLDGTDEISISGTTEIVRLADGHLTKEQFHPQILGLRSFPLSTLHGGTPNQRARDVFTMFSGKGRPALRQAVALNAAFGIQIGKDGCSLRDAYKLATAAMDNGSALRVIKKLREITNG